MLEGLQVATYEKGEYFLSHEDGFPKPLVEQNKFQRRATVLLYLNDVSEGGTTLFDWLGVSVKPEKGKALIFFPSFANGLPDDRTLHSAQDAVDNKWVAQQWVAAACKPQATAPATPLSGAAATAAAGRASLLRGKGAASRAQQLLKNGNFSSQGALRGQGVGNSSSDAVSDPQEETSAEQTAKASMSSQKRKKKQPGTKSKGFGS